MSDALAAAGFVYLVGAGPWDPGLLTLRGRALLERADTVVVDYLVNPALLGHTHPDAEVIPVGRPGQRMSQGEINALLVERGRRGEVVVRLKGGDPFVFGRGGEEAEALVSAGVRFEVVPGVTAAVASAAFAGIPVTQRGFGSTLAFVTGHQRADAPSDDVDWSALSRMATIVFYMGARRLATLAERLIAAGRPAQTPVAVIQWATRPDQQTLESTLEGCAEAVETAGLTAPLTVVVGEVVSLRRRIGWFERKPLHGLRVAVTRSEAQQGALSGRLAELGAEVLSLPTIAFEPTAPEPVRAAIDRLGSYDWVLFTSANGVEFFLDALWAAGHDPRAFAAARLACIGPATARRLERRGLRADLVPDEFVAEGLISALSGEGVAGTRVLIPRALVARETLPDHLRAAGATVDVIPVYRTIPAVIEPAVRARVAAGDVELVTFTASSTVDHFMAMFTPEEQETLRARIGAACIGPITAATARRHGLSIAFTADTYTIAGLADAMLSWRAQPV